MPVTRSGNLMKRTTAVQENQITVEGPDLIMTAISVSQNIETATSFIVSNTVKNIGMGASWGFRVEYTFPRTIT